MSSQPNSVRITWFMRRVALHAWTRAHTWTQVRCVKTTRWTAASVLQVSDVCVRVYGPFFDVLWRSFEALRLCVCVCVDAGTVFDDISLRGCIAQSECKCKHDKIYNSGEVYRQDAKEWYVKKGPYFFYDVTTYLYLVVGPLWCLFC